MSKQKQKYYVVWNGKTPGIYTSWDDCKEQVNGAEGAVYKSFASMAEAQQAFQSDPPYGGTMQSHKEESSKKVKKPTKHSADCPPNPPAYRHDTVLPLPPEVPADALAVDAACSGNPGKMEYRAVYLATGQEIFHFGPCFGTNNIGEFLAVVHALALLKKRGRTMPIYSDSRTALSWVRQKHCKSQLARTARTEELFRIVERAEQWLQANTYNEIPLRKWETDRWGEIPADFGRK